MDRREEIKQHAGEVKKEFKGRTLTYIGTALGLVAGLAWNEAITSLINKYYSAGNSILAKFIYAAIVTLVVVLILYLLTKAFGKTEENK